LDEPIISIIETGDGSHSLINQDLQEAYHSARGAVTESRHVFIKSGLEAFLRANPEVQIIKILETGFGTGLNALLALQFAESKQLALIYHTIEAYPVPAELAKKLNYTRQPDLESYKVLFNQLHTASWNEQVLLGPGFTFQKSMENLKDVAFPSAYYDVVFFDMFSPRKQPEVWEKSILERIYAAQAPGSLLVTYCSQSAFRQHLEETGYQVEKIAGPPGKREMVRALKQS